MSHKRRQTSHCDSLWVVTIWALTEKIRRTSKCWRADRISNNSHSPSLCVRFDSTRRYVDFECVVDFVRSRAHFGCVIRHWDRISYSDRVCAYTIVNAHVRNREGKAAFVVRDEPWHFRNWERFRVATLRVLHEGINFACNRRLSNSVLHFKDSCTSLKANDLTRLHPNLKLQVTYPRRARVFGVIIGDANLGLDCDLVNTY